MNKQSLTIVGLIVAVIGFILDRSGVQIAPADIQTTIEVLVTIGGLTMAWIGRVRQGDITILGRKKEIVIK